MRIHSDYNLLLAWRSFEKGLVVHTVWETVFKRPVESYIGFISAGDGDQDRWFAVSHLNFTIEGNIPFKPYFLV